MDKIDILTLFDYNYWANVRVLDAAGRVTPAQYTTPAGLSHGSLRGSLVHTLGAEIVWRLRCQEGISPPALPSEEKYPSLENLRTGWQDEELAMRAYLESLSDDRLRGIVRYRTTKGALQEDVLWTLLAHVVNHGTQFRSEATIALTAYGQSPGDLDMLLFFRERARQGNI